ncbi:MAG: sensor histidine kinase [Gemmatimonadales bacterium]
MRLATRLFAAASLLLAAAVAGSMFAADVVLSRSLETEIAAGLEREARLVAALLPPDSSRWPDAARALGAAIGHRMTLIDPAGRVLGDTEFDRDALPRLENHASRPEVRAAFATGTGRDHRLSASTNERQLYVAVRGGPPGLGVVRVSASLAAVDATVHGVLRALAGAGTALIAGAAVIAWLWSRVLAGPLRRIAGAAGDIAVGHAPSFPAPRVPELAQLVDALRAMHRELDRRFADLRREREDSRALIESLSDGVLAADARGTIVSCNAAALRLLGYRDMAALPALPELFHDKAHRALVRELLDGGEVSRRELDLDGRSVAVSGRPLPDGGTLLVLSDVTDLRRVEAVRRDFVANVSHELKTPLTSIVGYAETLAGEAEPGSQSARFADIILSNARRMQRLVDDLLDLSRIESGHWQPRPAIVDIEAAARDAWAPFAERAAGGGVSLETALAPEARALAVDPDALRQILTNLYDNALRHTPDGGRIRVSATLAPDGVAIAVADTGSGIVGQHLPRIFERFYRADPGRSRKQGGTGLGLAIVKHLVEAHGGRVLAESALGRGTTIRLFFPSKS